MINKAFENKSFLQLLSLFVAVMLWVYVGLQNPETTVNFRDIPVQIVMQNAQLENGVSVIGAGGESVDITLLGNKNVLSQISADDIYATIEVDSSLSPGVYSLPVNITLPLDEVTITSKNPAGYNIRVDRMVTASIPVRADVDYNFSEDIYVVDLPTINPETIEVRGPQTEISVLKEAVVKVDIDESNMAADAISLPVTIYDTSDNIADIEFLESAGRTASFTPNILERKILPVDVEILNLPEGWLSEQFEYSVVPQTVEITVPVSSAASMQEYDAGVIDLADYETGGTVVFDIEPEFIGESGVDSIEVLLRFGELVTASAPLSEIEVDDDGGLSYSVLSSLPLEVSVRGTPEAMETFDGSTMVGVLDLTGIASGQTVDLPLRVITGSANVGVLGDHYVTVVTGNSSNGSTDDAADDQTGVDADSQAVTDSAP